MMSLVALGSAASACCHRMQRQQRTIEPHPIERALQTAFKPRSARCPWWAPNPLHRASGALWRAFRTRVRSAKPAIKSAYVSGSGMGGAGDERVSFCANPAAQS